MYEIYERLLRDRKVKTADVCRATGIGSGTMSDWKNGRSTPKADKLKKIADFFDVPVGIFYSDDPEVQISGQAKVYYENAETAQLAQEMFEDRDMRALYDMKKNMSPERFAIQMRAFKDLYRLEHPEEFPEDYND